MPQSDEETADYSPVVEPEVPVVAASFDEVSIEIGALTHPGRVRSRNEDQYAVVRRTRTGLVLASSLPDGMLPTGEEHAWLLVVADGLGGEVSGDVASATAIRTVLEFANRLSSWIMRPGDDLRDDIADRADLYAQAIQREMQEQAKLDPGLAGMATTLTAAYVFGEDAVVVNIGDSRTYLIRSNQIHQITHDHTLAQEMQDDGRSPQAARPFRNVVSRCFTTEMESAKLDLFHVRLAVDDQLLLCTDGLTDMLADPEILRITTAASSAKDGCEQLVAAALDHGGRDNVTVVLARLC